MDPQADKVAAEVGRAVESPVPEVGRAVESPVPEVGRAVENPVPGDGRGIEAGAEDGRGIEAGAEDGRGIEAGAEDGRAEEAAPHDEEQEEEAAPITEPPKPASKPRKGKKSTPAGYPGYMVDELLNIGKGRKLHYTNGAYQCLDDAFSSLANETVEWSTFCAISHPGSGGARYAEFWEVPVGRRKIFGLLKDLPMVPCSTKHLNETLKHIAPHVIKQASICLQMHKADEFTQRQGVKLGTLLETFTDPAAMKTWFKNHGGQLNQKMAADAFRANFFSVQPELRAARNAQVVQFAPYFTQEEFEQKYERERIIDSIVTMFQEGINLNRIKAIYGDDLRHYFEGTPRIIEYNAAIIYAENNADRADVFDFGSQLAEISEQGMELATKCAHAVAVRDERMIGKYVSTLLSGATSKEGLPHLGEFAKHVEKEVNEFAILGKKEDPIKKNQFQRQVQQLVEDTNRQPDGWPTLNGYRLTPGGLSDGCPGERILNQVANAAHPSRSCLFKDLQIYFMFLKRKSWQVVYNVIWEGFRRVMPDESARKRTVSTMIFFFAYNARHANARDEADKSALEEFAEFTGIDKKYFIVTKIQVKPEVRPTPILISDGDGAGADKDDVVITEGPAQETDQVPVDSEEEDEDEEDEDEENDEVHAGAGGVAQAGAGGQAGPARGVQAVGSKRPRDESLTKLEPAEKAQFIAWMKTLVSSATRCAFAEGDIPTPYKINRMQQKLGTLLAKRDIYFKADRVDMIVMEFILDSVQWPFETEVPVADVSFIADKKTRIQLLHRIWASNMYAIIDREFTAPTHLLKLKLLPAYLPENVAKDVEDAIGAQPA